MLTEPVECFNCKSISVNGGKIYCKDCMLNAIYKGFYYALFEYGIYKNGTQVIGCMERNIQDVLKEFQEENTAHYILGFISQKDM